MEQGENERPTNKQHIVIISTGNKGSKILITKIKKIMKKVKSILGICLMVMMITSCEKQETTKINCGTTCQNGGIVTSGCSCDCPPGFSGYHCEKQIIPSGYNCQGTITVHNQNLQICLRDFGQIDNDRIDVIINGSLYLSNYLLSGADNCFNVTVPKGDNWIGIIARSEGTISPCTPGVTINDGLSSQKFEIRSYVGGNNGAYIIDVVI